MELYVDLSHYFSNDFKQILISVNPEEKKLVQDVINYISKVFSLSNVGTHAIFKDEWYIFPNQPSVILKEKGVLKLREIASNFNIQEDHTITYDSSPTKLKKRKKRDEVKLAEEPVFANNGIHIEDEISVVIDEEPRRKRKKSKKCLSPQVLESFASDSVTCNDNTESTVVNSNTIIENKESNVINSNTIIENEECVLPEIDWNDPESYMKIKKKRKRKHNKSKKKNLETNETLLNRSLIKETKKNKQDKTNLVLDNQILETTDCQAEKTLPACYKNVDNNHSSTDMETENNVPLSNQTLDSPRPKFKAVSSNYTLGCPWDSDNNAVLTLFSNLLNLEQKKEVSIFTRHRPEREKYRPESDVEEPMVTEKIHLGPPEPIVYQPSEEIQNKFSSLLSLENRFKAKIFYRNGFHATSVKEFLMDSTYEGLPEAFGTGNHRNGSSKRILRNNSLKIISSADNAYKSVKPPTEYYPQKFIRKHEVDDDYASKNLTLESDSDLIHAPTVQTKGPEIENGSDCQVPKEVSTTENDEEEPLTPTFSGAAPTKLRSSRRYLSVGNLLKTLQNQQKEETFTANASIENNDFISREIKQEMIDNQSKDCDNSHIESYPLQKSLPSAGSIIATRLMSIDELFSPCYSDYKIGKVIAVEKLKLTVQFAEDCKIPENGWTKENFTGKDTCSVDWRDLKDVRLLIS